MYIEENKDPYSYPFVLPLLWAVHQCLHLGVFSPNHERSLDDDIVELGLLRGLEIDEIVFCGLLPEDQRFDDSLLLVIQFTYPEIKLEMHTGDAYPAEQLHLELENLALPRLEYDSLRTVLQGFLSDDAEVNNHECWAAREEGCVFESRMTALRLVQTTVKYLGTFRNKQSSALPRALVVEKNGAFDQGPTPLRDRPRTTPSLMMAPISLPSK